MSAVDDQSEKFFNSDVLSDEFFAEIVEKRLRIPREAFTVAVVLVSPATGNNDNYASVVYRAKIKAKLAESRETKVVDVIIKASLESMPELKEYGVFSRERFIYEEVMPSFERTWLETSGEEIQFGPQGIKFVAEPYEIIVLDDLKASGHVMLDKLQGLTADQCKLALTKLAKFHAISALHYQKSGVLSPFFDRANSAVDIESHFGQGFVRMHDEIAKITSNYENFEVYTEKLKKLNSRKLAIAMLNGDKPLKCGFKVLTHGDLWTNNLMYKLDESDSKALEVIMIDFQMNFWGSPTFDLFMFILTSASESVLCSQFDEIIEHYHHQLSSALKIVGYEQHIPSLKEIFDDLTEQRALAAVVPAYMFFVKNSGKAVNLDALLKEPDDELVSRMYAEIYECPVLENSVKYLVKFLDERGYLEP